MVIDRRIDLTTCRSGGFTLMEILMVVVIISVAAVIAVPMMGSAATSQIKSAGNVLAADIEYAKSMAISRQKNYSIVFDAASESYSIEDDSGNTITHPVRGGNYTTQLSSGSDLDRVSISTANFDDTQTLTFNYLGSPFNGDGTALNSGQVVLSADELTMTISVEPVTGYVTIQ
ncbi:hypothetical protein STSP2_02077 [Anaerohalosphaera lusitana]|uniref:Type II secretion system protein H n=1 Tax=Anaerohalosphaera lusitana TaxID=1936003 RepID=A0A1U9NMS4_9BACT|nr:GspH/FimT family protein [Anaerohalosphaera lusitana]AQT68900.1 hypothetical protein STSP2_02077 [Anaerohalosphaera lusitana]